MAPPLHLHRSLQGWATGRFGLFGVSVEPVSSPPLNYGGVALALVTLGLLVLVQPEAASAAAAAVSDGAGIVLEAQLSESLLPADDLAGAGAPLSLQGATSEEAAQGRLRAKRPAGASVSLNAGDVLVEKMSSHAPSPPPKLWDRLPPLPRRAFGTSLALLAGVLSGSTFTAPQ